MPSRPVRAALAVALLIAAPAVPRAQTAASPRPGRTEGAPAAPREQGVKEPSVKGLAARDRQKRCGAEWRALPATEKAAQGPRWPQYYSKCVRRLKEQRA
ncbi:hypothetical protein OPKNFCMD_0801 [Methylobacterium crusticola]|uniref:Uncharacterized protein n=1 Tax=Methylobacterium crusticola TaxID=1697972 RepID=A0ABQ4QTI9_9HYPH|nr:hypothetical protein [Methylobacterium crusticola]GJD48085.1 hypothetical protein OPKNFCMD_0801 [Methylobacterium crusticola]